LPGFAIQLAPISAMSLFELMFIFMGSLSLDLVGGFAGRPLQSGPRGSQANHGQAYVG
jgi:hypothetical protein